MWRSRTRPVNMAKASKRGQLARPPKRQKAKASTPETVADFQEAADRDEEAGGKHRVGDPQKSARAFLRALDWYQQGIAKHPSDFDLVYNKARLELEITQQPALVRHMDAPLNMLLQRAAESHRHACNLSAENADVRFNSAQVLVSLAEHLSEQEQSSGAIKLLQEALALLSACLSRQEMQLEQQRIAFSESDDGGVKLDADEKPGSNGLEQSAVIEHPLEWTDLLDTVHASLSALIILVSLVDPASLDTYADMARTLTEERGPAYISNLPESEQASARATLMLDRAIFLATIANVQYNHATLDLAAYGSCLGAFAEIAPRNLCTICAEAEAYTELVLSALEHTSLESSTVQLCWTHLKWTQDLYAQASNFRDDGGLEFRARPMDIHKARGDVELLRHRLVLCSQSADGNNGNGLPAAVHGSAATLVSNAQTYYRGSASLALGTGDDDGTNLMAQHRWIAAREIGKVLYGAEPKPLPMEWSSLGLEGNACLVEATLNECVEEGLVGPEVRDQVLSARQRR